VDRSCLRCGVDISARHGGAKYCSPKCQVAARDAAKRIPCAGCAKPIYHSLTSRPPGEARCRDCTRQGCGTAANYKKRGCRCAECRRANAVATAKYLAPNQHPRWISDVDRVAIYDRDNWTCQLCGDPVLLEVPHLHRDAPTLDHIEPQSLALIPNHDPSNLRTAHRGCNSARGNRVSA
jgi:5-methylcytosine-specific restriction endonuclease McrA